MIPSGPPTRMTRALAGVPRARRPAATSCTTGRWAEVAAFDGQPQRRYRARGGWRDRGRSPPPRSGRLHGRPRVLVRAARPGPRLRGARGPASGCGPVVGLREVAAREQGAIAVKLEPRLEPRPSCRRPLRLPASCRLPDTLQVGQTRIVELADDEALLAGFDKDTRYAVRRAEREGVAVAVFDDAGDCGRSTTSTRWSSETQRRAGFPMPPLERYRIAWRALASAGRASILEARRDGELLASGMLVIEGDAVVLPVQRLAARGARRAEALRQLRAAVGDDAARPRARRAPPRPVGRRAARRRARARVARRRPVQEGLRRPRGAPGPAPGTSSSTRPCTACAATTAARARLAARAAPMTEPATHGPRCPDRRHRARAGRRHPGRRGDRPSPTTRGASSRARSSSPSRASTSTATTSSPRPSPPGRIGRRRRARARPDRASRSWWWIARRRRAGRCRRRLVRPALGAADGHRRHRHRRQDHDLASWRSRCCAPGGCGPG